MYIEVHVVVRCSGCELPLQGRPILPVSLAHVPHTFFFKCCIVQKQTPLSWLYVIYAEQ